MKDKSTAYLLWCGCFFGLFGLHRLYAGRIGSGLLWLFTLGLFGIGQFIDLFLIPEHIDVANFRRMPQAGPVMSQTVVLKHPVAPIQMYPASPPPNAFAELERLGGLFDKGYITPEEFASGKQTLLGYGQPLTAISIVSTVSEAVDWKRSWHYAGTDGVQFGPVSTAEIDDLLRQQRISMRTMVWSDGMAQWEPLSHWAEALGLSTRA